eukprot:scaffold72070_cov75-Attheya_sp.AAC.1
MHCSLSLLGDDDDDGDTLGAVIGNLDGTVLGKDDEGSSVGSDEGNIITPGVKVGEAAGSTDTDGTSLGEID